MPQKRLRNLTTPERGDVEGVNRVWRLQLGEYDRCVDLRNVGVSCLMHARRRRGCGIWSHSATFQELNLEGAGWCGSGGENDGVVLPCGLSWRCRMRLFQTGRGHSLTWILCKRNWTRSGTCTSSSRTWSSTDVNQYIEAEKTSTNVG